VEREKNMAFDKEMQEKAEQILHEQRMQDPHYRRTYEAKMRAKEEEKAREKENRQLLKVSGEEDGMSNFRRFGQKNGPREISISTPGKSFLYR
jgi:hypothetical protein